MAKPKKFSHKEFLKRLCAVARDESERNKALAEAPANRWFLHRDSREVHEQYGKSLAYDCVANLCKKQLAGGIFKRQTP